MWFDPSSAPGWYDYLGLVLTVVGFFIAIVQLRKTRNAAEEAISALGKAQKALSERQLSIVTSEMKTVSDELLAAQESNNYQLARSALTRYAALAKEAGPLARAINAKHEQVSISVTDSAKSALDAVGRFDAVPPRTVLKITRVFWIEMMALWVELRSIGFEVRNEIGEAPDVHK